MRKSLVIPAKAGIHLAPEIGFQVSNRNEGSPEVAQRIPGNQLPRISFLVALGQPLAAVVFVPHYIRATPTTAGTQCR